MVLIYLDSKILITHFHLVKIEISIFIINTHCKSVDKPDKEGSSFITNTNTEKHNWQPLTVNFLNPILSRRNYLVPKKIRSVSENLAGLEILIEKRKLCIIALTENWFKNNEDVNLPCLESF